MAASYGYMQRKGFNMTLNPFVFKKNDIQYFYFIFLAI